MRFASLVSCTDNYKQFLNAQLNSFDYYGHKHDVHIIALDVDPEYLDRILETDWTFNVIIHEKKLEDYERLAGMGKNMISKKARYEALVDMLDYDALLFLDADLFCVNNVTPFLDMVAGTDIIVGVNERFKWRLDEFSYENERLPARRMDWMICNAPTFFSPRRNESFIRTANAAATKCKNIPKNAIPSDLFTMNLALYLAGVTENVVALPAYSWTGVHQQYLNIFYRISKKGERWVSESGEPVYMIHGRWDRPATWEGMLREQEKRYNEVGMGDEHKKKYRAKTDATIREIRAQYDFFNNGYKLKLS